MKKKKMLMLARPSADNKREKKNYIYMEKPTVKENFIKKKKPTTIIKFSLAREEERSNEQFCGKKKYKSAKANHKKPLSQEYKSSSLTSGICTTSSFLSSRQYLAW
jgi:hypothetical protein